MEPEAQNNPHVSDSEAPQKAVTSNLNGPQSESDAPDSKEGSSVEATTSDGKAFAIIGYILPFLFFLPLLNDKSKNDPFARFHANQQLILLILVLGITFLHSTLLMMPMSVGYLIIQVLNLVILAAAVYGAYHAYKGEMKEFPVIGKFRILK